MDKFLTNVRSIGLTLGWIFVALAILGCFFEGLSTADRGGGSLAGGALISATLILLFGFRKR